MQRGRGGHAGQRSDKSPKGKVPFQKIRKPDLRPKTVPISKRIRDVTRLLNKPDLDTAVKAAQEKKLAALTDELEQRKRVALERKYASRYHKIRFFERVKLERRLAKLSRQQASSIGLSSAEESEMQQLVEDLQYVLNFPKGEKYISILKTAEEPEAQAHLEAERARLRGLVQQQMAEAALVGDADEGRSLAAKVNRSNAKRKSDAENLIQDKRKKKRSQEGSEESDEEEAEASDDVGVEGEEGEEEKDDFFLFGSEDEDEMQPANALKSYKGEDDDEEEEEGDAILSSVVEEVENLKGSDRGEKEEEKEDFREGRPYTQDGASTRKDFRKVSGRGRGRGEGWGRGAGSGGGGGDGFGRGRGDRDRHRGSRDPVPFRGLGGTKPLAKPPSDKKKPVASSSKKAKAEKQPQRKRAEGGRKRRK